MAIQTPFTFYYVNNNSWSNASSLTYQYWNKNFTAAASVNNTATLKTIYSPSPSGFAEPQTAAFTGFTSTGGNVTNSSQFNVGGTWNKGWNYYTNGWKTGSTVFFAGLGYRTVHNGATGTLAGNGKEGCFWTSGASTVTNARYIGFGTDYVAAQTADPHSYGFSVRSVKE